MHQRSSFLSLEPHPLTAPLRPRELLFPNRSADFLMISSSTHCSASPHLCQMTVQYSVASVTVGLLFLSPQGGGCGDQRGPPEGPLHQPEGHLLRSGPSLSNSVNSHSWALRENQQAGSFLLPATHNTPSPLRLSLRTVRSPPPWQGWEEQAAAAMYQISYLLTQTLWLLLLLPHFPLAEPC